ncbi:MAG: hypothetical protein JEZ03_04625 [Bacteroidales bacterium]|nr:hypothetical protein [Bacteroidales bacterium]
MKKLIIQSFLAVIIAGLGYFLFESIMEPVRFKQERLKREDVVVQRLKDIRSAQLAFKALNDSFAPTFDTLIDFIKLGQIPVVKIVPDPMDTTFTKTIKDTIGYTGVVDSLFKKDDDGVLRHFNPDRIRFVPLSDNVEFAMAIDEIKRGGVTVKVIEVQAMYKDILWDMDKQMRINFIKTLTDIDKFPGVKFGSLIEPSVDGNWE